MGYDSYTETAGYLENGETPTFKVMRETTGEEFILSGNFPVWANNELYTVGVMENLPESYSLAAAYPNPFNPSTTINFSIPSDAQVSIAVYNLQGREVVSLASGRYNAGYHQVIWNADTHSSGVYFVKMVAGSYVNTQKLMLVK
jgi:hypothetical protein